ncbi:MAG TPA: O-methyltransferase [Thermoleophilaceae bacterium]|nr:O-methyltransferase [Thermoleophilaceae bacterium]
MHEKFTALTPDLHAYMVERGARQDEVLRRVERETEAMGDVAVMQIAADQGALITLLVRALGVRYAVEVGTFTGYSAICMARGLVPGGRLLCCELSEDYARTALENLAEAGLADSVDMRVGSALDTLRSLPREESVDFAFVDADKPAYGDYYEELLARMRPGGVIMLDNVLLGGRVLDPPEDDDSAQAMAQLNDSLAGDERVDVAMIGVADGVTLVRKR